MGIQTIFGIDMWESGTEESNKCWPDITKLSGSKNNNMNKLLKVFL